MLTKLLVTGLVILIAWKYITRRQRDVRSYQQVHHSPSTKPFDIVSRKVKWLAVGLLVLAVSIVIWQWWLGFEKLNVIIVSPNQGTTDTYTVRKRDIGDDQIVTVDGITIRLSRDERVEITPKGVN